MSNHENNSPKIPYLSVQSNGEARIVEIDLTANALIGSGGHCKVQLDGSDVQSLHCILAMNEGQFEVRDWNTGCTFVNGQLISEPVDFNEGDVLKIGDHEISVVLSESGAAAETGLDDAVESENAVEEAETIFTPVLGDGAEAVSEEDVSDQGPAVEEVVQENESTEQIESNATPVEDDEQSTETETESELEPVTESEDESEPVAEQEENDSVEPSASAPAEYVYDIDADFEDEPYDDSVGFAAPSFNSEDTSSDELQTLRMENEQLRFELSQTGSESQQDSDSMNREQTARLVTRLQDVLAELKRSDARSLDMQELLRSAEQATQDEKDERLQMEKWMSELESRVSQRESEAENEIQQLKKQLEEARESQQKSNDCLQSVMETKTGDGEAVPVELAVGLRSQMESLQAQLNSAQEESATLREQLEAASPSEEKLRQAEQELAELQLTVSRERAEISRQRVELNRLNSELEGKLTAASEEDDSREQERHRRFSEMREQLNELNEKEKAKADESESTGNGLSDRITGLLNRVSNE